MHVLQVFWIFLLSNALAEEPIPYVFWTMDNVEGTKIVPENNTDSRFRADFSRLHSNASHVFVPGVVGNALLVKEKEFDLAQKITRSDCIRTTDACESGGLSFAFWLNILKWNSASFQIFFRTTTATKGTPGIYFGRGNDENLLVYFREGSGKFYETTFPQSYFWNTWSHIAIVWSNDVDPAIYVNGSVISSSTTVGNDRSRSASSTDFVIGSSLAPDFMFDEFKVFYQNLSALEAMDVYMGDLDHKPIISTTRATTKTIITTKMSSTTTTSTTAPSTTVSPTTTTTIPPTTTVPPPTTTSTTISQHTGNIQSTAMVSTPCGNTTVATTIATSRWNPNVLLGILIPLLVALVSAIMCLLLVCCCRDRKAKKMNEQTVRYTEVRTADSDAPYSSNPGTDAETDAENERQKPLIRPV